MPSLACWELAQTALQQPVSAVAYATTWPLASGKYMCVSVCCVCVFVIVCDCLCVILRGLRFGV